MMHQRLRALVLTCSLLVFGHAITHAAGTQLVNTDGQWKLLRDGQPYFIQGAGGDRSLELLKQIGGNSIRTWDAKGIDALLDEAHKLGITVTVGIWLDHERHGFNYSDPQFIARQFAKVEEAVRRYKDHPAVLMWAIGNEMEGASGENAAIWSHIEACAALVKRIDPTRPTMTVIAEIGGSRVQHIHKLCPSIDIIGINSYAGAPSLPGRYRAAGGTKPYIITEFGPHGTWEVVKTDWDAAIEPTSSQKADQYRQAYTQGVLGEKGKLCLGSYVFKWGHKQEATATWFGMFLKDGSRTASVDTMQELWTGKPPTNRVPRIEPLAVETQMLSAGATFVARVQASDPDNDALEARWFLKEEAKVYGIGGDAEPVPTLIEGAVIESSLTSATVKMPDHPGRYRLFVEVRDSHGTSHGVATANIPLFIPGEIEAGKERLAAPAKLPLVLYGEGQEGVPYVWSGWMGKLEAIANDEKSKDQPKAGATCMKLSYNSPDGFGGIVWQSPVNDWGDAPGGFDLTGATKLTFWARGAAGGERVEFKFGVLGREKAFPDTAGRGITVELTPAWKQYTIDLAGLDLRRIKTGFAWVVANPGRPVSFYLDEVRYE